MTSTTMKPDALQPAADMAGDLFDNWFDPLEAEVRARSREFIEELLRGELEAALSRPRYGRRPGSGSEGSASVAGHRHGSRTRSLTGTFGPIEIAVPRARLATADGKTTEWKSQTLRAYQRRTLAADALIASTYLAGTNTRRVRRALAALFGGTVGKDTVSRTWRKVKSDWDAWHTRSLTGPADRAPDPRRHRGARAARPQGDLHLAAGRSRRARRRPEGAARDQEHGRRARAPRPGALSSLTSSIAGCGVQNSSSSERRGSTRPSPPSGTACRSSAARSTSTGTCSHMPPSGCMMRSLLITTT
jgi:hypothetical protein